LVEALRKAGFAGFPHVRLREFTIGVRPMTLADVRDNLVTMKRYV